MSRDNAPPFGRGKTYGATAATDGVLYEGRECVFEDIDWSAPGSGPKPVRSNRPVRTRIVRNACAVGSGGESGTGALLPKRLVTFKSGTYNNHVDGYARLTATGPTRP